MTGETPVDILASEPETINPAIILADQLMRREVADLLTVAEIKHAEQVLEVGTREIETIERHKAAFLKSPATCAAYIPCGFWEAIDLSHEPEQHKNIADISIVLWRNIWRASASIARVSEL